MSGALRDPAWNFAWRGGNVAARASFARRAPVKYFNSWLWGRGSQDPAHHPWRAAITIGTGILFPNIITTPRLAWKAFRAALALAYPGFDTVRRSSLLLPFTHYDRPSTILGNGSSSRRYREYPAEMHRPSRAQIRRLGLNEQIVASQERATLHGPRQVSASGVRERGAADAKMRVGDTQSPRTTQPARHEQPLGARGGEGPVPEPRGGAVATVASADAPELRKNRSSRMALA